MRRLRDTLAERLHGSEVGSGYSLPALIGIGLCHGADRSAQTIEVIDRAFGVVVARRQPQAYPDHAVLQGQDQELVERILLVAVPGRRGGEAGGQLVAPAAL